MPIQYIPRQRSPWEQLLPGMAGSLFEAMLQQQMWKKQFGMQQEAARTEAERLAEEPIKVTKHGPLYIVRRGKEWQVSPEREKTRPTKLETIDRLYQKEKITKPQWERAYGIRGPEIAPGQLKIGMTKEVLISKVARGEELTEPEQQAYDMITGIDKVIASDTIRLLSDNFEYQMAETEEERLRIVKETTDLVRSIHGLPSEQKERPKPLPEVKRKVKALGRWIQTAPLGQISRYRR